jgi:uncharacterized protein (DUF1499 family)
MTIRRGVVWLAVAVLAALAAYVRLAPVDPDRWHVDLGALARDLGNDPAQEMQVGTNSASMRIVGEPDVLMARIARLDKVALATARTRRIAGDPAQGWVTWETRSLIFGFPDYTTAQVTDGALVILARSRFGRGDWGVNAARLQDWLLRLQAP